MGGGGRAIKITDFPPFLKHSMRPRNEEQGVHSKNQKCKEKGREGVVGF